MRVTGRGFIAAFGTLITVGCATAPLAPDQTIDPRGRWTVVAVSGEPTGGGERFGLEIAPPQGSAIFGCNTGSGSLAVTRGWLVPGDWIITTGACLPAERMLFERRGFDILAQPMAIEARAAGGIRLRNRDGMIELVRTPATVIAVIGEWTATAIDGQPTNAAYAVSFTAHAISGNFGCNLIRGGYQLVGSRLVATSPWAMTERGCFDPTGKRDVMAAEQRAFAILISPLTVSAPSAGTLRLRSARGSIDLARR